MARRDVAALRAALERIPAAVRAEIMPAIEKGADELVSRMRYLVPEDKGELKDSIRKSPGKVPLAVHIEAVDHTNRTPGFDNALAQEYGTAETAAQPFFWPSVNTSKKRIRRRIDKAISKAITRAWGKI